MVSHLAYQFVFNLRLHNTKSTIGVMVDGPSKNKSLPNTVYSLVIIQTMTKGLN